MGMTIGVPKEHKVRENRVGLIPAAVAELTQAGHQVFVQQGAGIGSGYTDAHYQAVGADLVPTIKDVYGSAELIVKVKEPIDVDLAEINANHTLFCYLHLAAGEELTKQLCNIGCKAIAFETVTGNGGLPLLAPMSAIAGRIAVQAGAHYLHSSQVLPDGSAGKGVLLGGGPGTDRGQVTVIGAGVAGYHACAMAAGMGANVTVFDKKPEALQRVTQLGANINGQFAFADLIEASVEEADLVIGAVLIPGAKAPKVVSEETVKRMAPGSVIVDISIDQGGCVETMKATNYETPTFIDHGVIHMGVTNLPGAVARTSSQALSGALIPYVLTLANGHLELTKDLKAGLNVSRGKVVHGVLRKIYPGLSV